MKQEEKSMASKGRVLEAAASLFIRKGYEETTMQDIMDDISDPRMVFITVQGSDMSFFAAKILLNTIKKSLTASVECCYTK